MFHTISVVGCLSDETLKTKGLYTLGEGKDPTAPLQLQKFPQMALSALLPTITECDALSLGDLVAALFTPEIIPICIQSKILRFSLSPYSGKQALTSKGGCLSKDQIRFRSAAQAHSLHSALENFYNIRHYIHASYIFKHRKRAQ